MESKFDKRLSEIRRKQGEKSVLHFARIYLQHHVRDFEASLAHLEIYDLLDNAMLVRGKKIVIAAPRGFGKSTLISLANVLYAICYATEKNMLVVSETQSLSREFLEHIKYELLNNNAIAEDFPEVFETMKPRPARWNEREIRTKNRIKVMALGVNQQIRGTKYNNIRPTLIILDDIESAKTTASPEARLKLKDWLTKVILNIGSEATNVVMVGNIHHVDSLMAEYTHPTLHPDWIKRVYRSIIQDANHTELWETWRNIYHFRQEYKGQNGEDGAVLFYNDNKPLMLEGAEVLWPQRWDYYYLMKKQVEDPIAFQSEQQNNPIDPRNQIFNLEEFHYWDAEYASVEALQIALGSGLKYFAACDPSLGHNPDKGDYSAIIVLAWHSQTKTMHVVEADIKRRKPDELLMAILALNEKYGFEKLAMETNSGQELLIQKLKDMAREQGRAIAIEEVTNTRNKLTRISSIQPYTQNGMIKFTAKHKQLLDQLRDFPRGKHDDGPDALEMAVKMTLNRTRIADIGLFSAGPYYPYGEDLLVGMLRPWSSRF